MLACRCQPLHRGRPVDVERLNRAWRASGRFLIVPGYCPHFGWQTGLHPRAIARLERAEAADGDATIIVSGGAVHSDDNEAVLMREWLLKRGIDPARILVEPCARHTTTNLRNAGRMVLAAGASEALVVTSREQWLYLAHPWRSSFHLRCLVQLGYRVGELGEGEDGHVWFRPSPQVFRTSGREARAGDP
jgi:hypothetical protein